MLSNESKYILESYIDDLPFSDQFKQVMREHGIKSLRQLVSIKVWQLMEKPGVSMHIVAELVKYLDQNHMGEFINH